MPKRFFIVLVGLALLLSQPIHAQKEGAVWYFGQNAGLDFKANYPTPLSNGQIKTREGVATICNKDGDLLFYTDGQTVYDSTHQIMMNGEGLYGDASSTQSSIIVPRPGSGTQYYIFTVDQAVAAPTPDYKGLNYSIVDMAQNYPYGKVTDDKNVPLIRDPNTLFTEKIAVVKKPNGDYWIIAHQFGYWVFYEFLLTKTGITLVETPSAGSAHLIDPGDRVNRGATGYLKSSPKGEFLVAAVEGQHFFELFSFNQVTGEIKLIVRLPAGDTLDPHAEKEAAYGVEFSPTSNYLYGSTRKGGIIYQWDISVLNADAIKKSVHILRQNSSVLCGALQLGLNGKIYVSLAGQPYLGKINSPIQKNCDYIETGVVLKNNETGEGGKAYYGLPTFLSDFFKEAKFYYENTCQNDLTRFYLSTKVGLDGLPAWRILDATGTFIANATVDPVTLEGTYRFSQPGTYKVQLIASQFGSPITPIPEQEVIIFELPKINWPDTTRMCQGVPVTLDAGDGAFYNWSDNPNLNVVRSRIIYQPGKYVVTVTHYSDCSNTDSTYIKQEPLPVIKDTLITAAACGSSNGSIELIMDRSPDQFKFIWTGYPDTTNLLSHLPGGVYEVNITSRTTGCSITKKLSVSNQNAPQVRIASTATGTVCPGTKVTLTASGALQYIWENPGGFITDKVDIYPDKTDTYRVKGYSIDESTKDTCFSIKDVLIEVYDVNPPVLGDLHEECQGDTVKLDGQDYVSWNWSNGATTRYVNITQSIDRLILFTTDKNQCVQSDTTRIVIMPLPVINLGDSITRCLGDSVTLSGNVAAEWYLWSPGSDTTETIRVNSPGINYYKLTVWNKGCISTDSIRVHFKPLPEVNLNMPRDTAVCSSKPVKLNVGPGDSYLWSTQETTREILAAQTGTYWVKTFLDGCADSDTVNLTIHTLPPVELGDDISQCRADSVRLDGGIAEHYLWSPGGDTLPEIRVNNTAWYYLTITDKKGCTNTDSIHVEIRPLPNVDLGDKTTYCISDSVKLNGGYGDSYLWSTNDTTPDIFIKNSGIYWLKITQDGCINSDTVDLTLLPAPPVELGDNISQCKAEPVRLYGGPGEHYLWSPGGDTLSEIRVNNTAWYYLTITDKIGCPNTDSIYVEIKPYPIVNLGPDTTFCVLDSMKLNGGEGDTFLWSTRDTTPEIYIRNSGLYWVTITRDGCAGSDSVQLFTKPLPKADLGKDTIYCTRDPITLTANQGGSESYLWSTGENSTAITVDKTGKYWVTVAYKGCVNSDTVMIRLNDPDLLIIDSVRTTPVTCAGNQNGSLVVYSHGSGLSYEYSINDGLTYSDSPYFEGLYGKNNFRVVVREDKTCITRYPEEIIFNEPDSLLISYHLVSPSCETCPDGIINLSITGGTPPYSVKWSTNDTVTYLYNMELGKYLVWITDAANCRNSAMIDLNMDHPPFQIPNAFTPNGDGINENWDIASLKEYPECQVKIFDRSGHLIWWSDTGYTTPWDGKDKSGTVMPVGAYYYLIWLRSDLNPLKGSVSVLR